MSVRPDPGSRFARPGQAHGTRSRPRPISVWRAPDDGRGPWFPIAAMQRMGVTIELSLNGARQLVGKLELHPRNKRPFWWEWRETIEEWAPLQMWTRPDAPLPEYKSDRTPMAWRPLLTGVWPDPLPEPLTGAALAPSIPASSIEIEPLPPQEPHGWPYPGLPLGECVPAKCREEAEARVLRGWRTLQALPGQDYIGGGDLCWPRDWYVLGQRIDALERYLNGEIETHVPPVRSTWLATRRDQGDWRYALAWMNGLSEAHQRIIRLRAADPPYTWSEIARKAKLASRQGAAARYEAAIDAVWAAARVALAA